MHSGGNHIQVTGIATSLMGGSLPTWQHRPTKYSKEFPGYVEHFGRLANSLTDIKLTIPSTDGKLYLQQGFDRVSKGLDAAGFKYLDKPNDHPNEKNFTYGHAAFFIDHAERHGVLRTYLETAAARTNKFTLWTSTNARRVVRTKGHVTGVELECRGGLGKSGVVNVTPGTGRVIVSAGTMGSAKVLLRSKLYRVFSS